MRPPPRSLPGRLAIEPSLRGVPRIEEFLHFIVADPDDDASRLVLADYLTDFGMEERAELIRLQCRMYRLEEEGQEAGAEYGRLERRSDAILARNAEAWKPGRELANCLFHRGLLETYRVDNLSQFLEAAPQVVEQTTIQVLRIRDGRVLRRLDAVLGFDQLYELDLAGARRDQGDLIALASSPRLTTVRELNLDYHPLWLQDWRALADSPFLQALRILSLRATQFHDEGVEALSRAPWFGRLVRLDLAGHRLTPHGVRLLVSTVQPSLNWLDLGGHHLGVALAEALAQGARLVGLRTLLLGGCFYGPEEAHVLAQMPFPAGLKRLGLANNALGGQEVEALLRSACLTKLTELDLEGNGLGSSGVRWPFANPPGISSLTALNLGGNGLNDRDVEELIRTPQLHGLTQLFLDHNWITDVGAGVLASSSLGSLRLLSLENNQIHKKGAHALFDSLLAARGTEIRLFRNPISREVRELLRDRCTIRPDD